MKYLFVLICSLFLIGCGAPATSTAPAPTLVDPTGNWQWVASDSTGAKINLSGEFYQTGAVVTASNFQSINNTASYTCGGAPYAIAGSIDTIFLPLAPLSYVTLGSGNVGGADGNTFTGTLDFISVPGFPVVNYGTASFTSTLDSTGLSLTGTYSDMPTCTGLESSGTLTGQQVPTLTGTHDATMTPCSMNEATLVCTPTGDPGVGITFVFVQNDSNGELSGTFNAASGPLTSGTFDFLGGYGGGGGFSERFSGQMLETPLYSANSGPQGQLYGTIGLTSGFQGYIWIPASSEWFTLTW